MFWRQDSQSTKSLISLSYNLQIQQTNIPSWSEKRAGHSRTDIVIKFQRCQHMVQIILKIGAKIRYTFNYILLLYDCFDCNTCLVAMIWILSQFFKFSFINLSMPTYILNVFWHIISLLNSKFKFPSEIQILNFPPKIMAIFFKKTH